MTDLRHSRRHFMLSAGSTLGAGWLALNLPGIAAAAHAAHASAAQSLPPAWLTAAEAADVEAIAAQIIPGDDTPGAREAGVIHFIDAALASFYGEHAAQFRDGLGEFQRSVATRFPQAQSFSALDDAGQIAWLHEVDQTPFFQTVRFLTVLGLLSSPAYGGNRNGLGWQLMGFEDTHAYQPPFGYYDRDYPGFTPYPAVGK
jgi:gluconate 2-dehydrogenase gamma chain